MAGGYRASDAQYAERVNAAADLVQAGMPAAQAAGVLAERFAVSVRQARRYVDQAASAGRRALPEESVVFTVKLPASLVARVRAQAREAGITISAVVAGSLAQSLPPKAARRR